MAAEMEAKQNECMCVNGYGVHLCIIRDGRGAHERERKSLHVFVSAACVCVCVCVCVCACDLPIL